MRSAARWTRTRHRHIRLPGAIGLAVATAFSLGAAPPQGAAPPDPVSAPAPAPAAARPAGEQPRAVTLITGDRVLLTGAGRSPAGVERAPGRTGVRFSSYRVDGHQYVVPEDARHLLRAGRVDRRLFDVTALLGAGYHDRGADLPLTVDGERRGLPAAQRAAFWKDLAGRSRAAVPRTARAQGPAEDADGPLVLLADGASADLGSPAAEVRADRGADAPGRTRAAADSSTLTVRHLDRDGTPAADSETMVVGLDAPVRHFLHDDDGTAQARLPRGRYLLVGDIVDRAGNWHRVVRPLLDLTGDTVVTVDARTTRPVTTAVARPGARPAAVDLGIERHHGDRVISVSLGSAAFGRLYTAQLGPSVPAAAMTSGISSTWGAPGPAGDFSDTPYSYHLLDTRPGGFFTGFERRVRDAELARLEASHLTQTTGRRGVKGFFGKAPGFAAVSGTMLPVTLPSRVTHYLDTRDTEWSGAFGEQITGADGFGQYATAMGSDYRAYRAGQRTTERWNAAVFAPFLFRPDHAGRKGDTMWVGVPLFTDQDDHRAGSLTDSESIRLYRDGRLVGVSGGGQLTTRVPPGPGRFRIESSASRPSWFRLSDRVKSVWTFSSDTTPGAGAPLPLWAVRYFPRVDAHNNLVPEPGRAASRTFSLPLSAEPHPGADTGAVRSLRLNVSTDGGATWRPAPVVPDGSGGWRATVPRPARRPGPVPAGPADRRTGQHPGADHPQRPAGRGHGAARPRHRPRRAVAHLHQRPGDSPPEPQRLPDSQLGAQRLLDPHHVLAAPLRRGPFGMAHHHGERHPRGCHRGRRVALPGQRHTYLPGRPVRPEHDVHQGVPRCLHPLLRPRDRPREAPMRVLFTVWPNPSHLYPVVPLAWALRSAGHEVCVAAHPEVADAIAAVGLTAVPLGDPALMPVPLGPGRAYTAERAQVARVTEELALGPEDGKSGDISV
nr:peptidase S8 [Streptomyces clavuligerus]